MIKTKNILFFLVISSFLFVAIKFYSFVVEYSSWQYADWLINYQGGLVRRGLIGEILFNIYNIFNIDLDKLILFFVVFLYAIFSYYLIKCIKYIENSYLNILIFLSPGLFIYPIMNSGIIGRKEIFLLTLIGSFVFFEKKINLKYHLIILILTLILLSLSHSAFIFYMPYFIFLYILIKNNRGLKIKFNEIFIIAITLIFLIFFINFFNGSEIGIKKICESVKEFSSENCGKSGQIFLLNLTAQGYLVEKLNIGENFLRNYFIVYIISAIIVFFFISVRLINSKFKKNFSNLIKYNPFLIFFILFLLTIPVYIFGRDWGRYIYISYSCTFFLYIYFLKNNILTFNKSKILNFFKFKKITFIIFIFFYSFFWTFPFYDANNFKLVLNKPIKTIIKKLK